MAALLIKACTAPFAESSFCNSASQNEREDAWRAATHRGVHATKEATASHPPRITRHARCIPQSGEPSSPEPSWWILHATNRSSWRSKDLYTSEKPPFPSRFSSTYLPSSTSKFLNPDAAWARCRWISLSTRFLSTPCLTSSASMRFSSLLIASSRTAAQKSLPMGHSRRKGLLASVGIERGLIASPTIRYYPLVVGKQIQAASNTSPHSHSLRDSPIAHRASPRLYATTPLERYSPRTWKSPPRGEEGSA